MSQLRASFRAHWPEYAIEAAGIALFMASALGFSALLEHPGSPVHAAIANPIARRAWMGLAMGATAITLVYSPWGQRSGAHFNPALTFTFFRLGKISAPDALGYALAQFAGAIAGVLATSLAIAAVARPPGRSSLTGPGAGG